MIREMVIFFWFAEELLVDACQIFSKLPHLGVHRALDNPKLKP